MPSPAQWRPFSSRTRFGAAAHQRKSVRSARALFAACVCFGSFTRQTHGAHCTCVHTYAAAASCVRLCRECIARCSATANLIKVPFPPHIDAHYSNVCTRSYVCICLARIRVSLYFFCEYGNRAPATGGICHPIMLKCAQRITYAMHEFM